MDPKEKGKVNTKRLKTKDLTTFWSSGITSNFSPREAAAANVPYVEDQGGEEDDYNSDAEFEQAVYAVEEEMEGDRATIQKEEEIENHIEAEMVESDAQPEGIITQFNPDHIITDPGLRIPIDQFHVDIRSDGKIDAFMKSGSRNILGLNTVSKRIRLIVSIVIFLSKIAWMTN
ncbi:unnamed protein product [Miscanthus lutarioriparius]|uniref:Uncharacterized protein n=1 Tax=Miscanthus lutarioriparius TaxID=422564 RepID=A0A811PP47_9POAL|nr:unnamed protein product [Miscanthus lutarioriparius]